MRSVSGGDAIVVPFRRPGAARPFLDAGRRDQRSFMDAVYSAGSLPVAAGDRETKLVASRLQVYGFVSVDQVETDGSLRRLKASEAVRAACDRPWRVTKTSYGAEVSLGGAARDDAFLFEDEAAGFDQAG